MQKTPPPIKLNDAGVSSLIGFALVVISHHVLVPAVRLSQSNFVGSREVVGVDQSTERVSELYKIS